MSYRVEISAPAHNDLVDVREWIMSETNAETAEQYIDRVKARLGRLTDFPNRGTPRSDLAPGLRTLSFERRLIIAYRVELEIVRIVRVVDAKRDLRRLFN
jgi:toxin ParE1/3/4